jgi:quercetin 2,3-dioxygenase
MGSFEKTILSASRFLGHVSSVNSARHTAEQERKMIEHRPVSEIGGTELNWLRAKHHFRIGAYGNPAHKPIGNLYVWNDDEIAPHTGFPPHNHSDVEIVTYVREGVVTHQDNLGNVSYVRAGDVQVMSAGKGIRHSERNDGAEPARLFQIWLSPARHGGDPAWGTRPFPKKDRAGRFVLLASRSGRDGSLTIGSDADVLGAMLSSGSSTVHNLREDDKAYIVAATGTVEINGETLSPGDGAAINGERQLHVKAIEDAELVLVVATDSSAK